MNFDYIKASEDIKKLNNEITKILEQPYDREKTRTFIKKSTEVFKRLNDSLKESKAWKLWKKY